MPSATPASSARAARRSRALQATTQASSQGRVNSGSTMNNELHMIGRIGSGQNSWVPYTVKLSMKGCAIRQAKIAHHQRSGAWATRPPRRRKNAQIAQATKGSTSQEWVRPRWQVICATGSPNRASGITSRSGSVFSAAPASRAARRCAFGAMAAAMAPP